MMMMIILTSQARLVIYRPIAVPRHHQELGSLAQAALGKLVVVVCFAWNSSIVCNCVWDWSCV